MSASMVYFSRSRIILTVLICVLALAYAAPSLMDRKIMEPISDSSSRWLPVHPINLGLDLQGGSYLLLKVGIEEAKRDRLANLVDSVRKELQSRRIGYTGLAAEESGVGFVLRDAAAAGDQMRAVMQAIDPDMVLKLDRDSGKVSFALSETAIARQHAHTIEQSIEIIRRRVDETGTREPLIQRSGDDRILLQLPGVSDPQSIKRLLGQTAKMSFHLVDEAAALGAARAAPPGYMVVEDRDEAGRTYVIKRQPELGGETLTSASASMNSMSGQPVVSFKFDSVGARKFADITRANVGKQFAIVLDGKAITVPVIREPITGGNGQIDGNFTIQSANELALLLRAGALPAPLTVLEERTVGPGLGQDSIEAGKLAGLIGAVLVIAFVVASYGLFGLMAAFALTLNVAMIFALLSVLGATLTLPGIAGIVLTIGMAVDANVLIFERIREETRAGRSPISAIDAGYARAMTSIVDSNLTTIIAGLLLYYFGSGPVRGFAVTLTIGIITSMFAALMVTRLFVVVWLRRTRPTALHI